MSCPTRRARIEAEAQARRSQYRHSLTMGAIGLTTVVGATVAGMGPAESAEMVTLIGALRREMAILLIEHVMRAVMSLATRVLVLHHGAAIAEGLPAEVVREPAVVQSYLGAEAL